MPYGNAPQYPKNQEEMEQQGYIPKGKGTCKDCGEEFEWWQTPGNKHVPMNMGTAEPHWKTCPKAPPRKPQQERQEQTRPGGDFPRRKNRDDDVPF